MNLNFDTKYNYVIYNVGSDYLEPVFMPLSKYDSVNTYDLAINGSKILKKIFFLHWSEKINGIIKLPLKKLWFSKMFNQHFLDNKPVCYVFYMAKYINDDPSIYQYIKKLNENNKCIIYFGDSITKIGYDIEKLKKCSDYIVTYDKGEAEKYDIVYGENSLGYGEIIDVTTPNEFENDVYFVGYAKDRLDEIHNTFLHLYKNNIKCKFIICGTKESDRLNYNGLIYSDPISYKDNLYNVVNSKCILDIIQKNSTGATLRVKESIAYKRKLLSSNRNLKERYFYNSETMSCFDKVEDIDIAFIKSDINYSSYKVDNDFGPEKTIRYFERLLGGNNE